MVWYTAMLSVRLTAAVAQWTSEVEEEALASQQRSWSAKGPFVHQQLSWWYSPCPLRTQTLACWSDSRKQKVRGERGSSTSYLVIYTSLLAVWEAAVPSRMPWFTSQNICHISGSSAAGCLYWDETSTSIATSSEEHQQWDLTIRFWHSYLSFSRLDRCPVQSSGKEDCSPALGSRQTARPFDPNLATIM